MSEVPAKNSKLNAASGVLLRLRSGRRSFLMGDTAVDVLKNANLEIRAGEFVAIEGRSGSGKSTLLHALGALDTLDAGKVEYDGFDYTALTPRDQTIWERLMPATLSDWLKSLTVAILVLIIPNIVVWFLAPTSRAAAISFKVLSPLLALCTIGLIIALIIFEIRDRPRARLRNSTFGFVFQFYFLLPELNVLENAMLAPNIRRRGRRSAEVRRRATELLETLGLGHRLTHRPAQLSGGERQRVAIARALMNEPRVLFADEPTGNLDADTGRQIMDLLEALHREKGQTIVMVTHDRALAREADRVLVLTNGQLQPAT